MIHERIKIALRDLPVGEGCHPDYDKLTNAILITSACGNASEYLTRNCAESIGQLKGVAKTADTLSKQLQSLSDKSKFEIQQNIASFDEEMFSTLAKLLPKLSALALAGANAEKKIDTNGRPKKYAASNVHAAAESAYKEITGKKRGTLSHDSYAVIDGGRFFEFLKTVYGILEIDASAAAMVRKQYRKPRERLV